MLDILIVEDNAEIAQLLCDFLLALVRYVGTYYPLIAFWYNLKFKS